MMSADVSVRTICVSVRTICVWTIMCIIVLVVSEHITMLL